MGKHSTQCPRLRFKQWAIKRNHLDKTWRKTIRLRKFSLPRLSGLIIIRAIAVLRIKQINAAKNMHGDLLCLFLKTNRQGFSIHRVVSNNRDTSKVCSIKMIGYPGKFHIGRQYRWKEERILIFRVMIFLQLFIWGQILLEIESRIWKSWSRKFKILLHNML